MGKKNKNKHKQQQQRRERKRHERNARQPKPSGPPRPRDSPRLPQLDPPEPHRCLPAIHIDATGKVIPDPYAELGIPDDADPEAIHAAFRARILERPPERAPEGARRLLDARERLLGEDRAIERALGVLRVPDPAAFGLPLSSTTDALLPAPERLVGQLALYALLEATFLDGDVTQTSLDLR